jgi:antitoxin (DNA-binding transcriptional repressor) of toxin-antitoxin stability system
MERISLSDAERDLTKLVDRVVSLGVSVDLERDNRVVARLSPVRAESKLKVRDFGEFLQNLPRLGEDGAKFSEDVRNIRLDFPPEASPWD